MIKLSKRRALVPLTLAGAIVCAVIFAGSGGAATPSAGVNCAADGKVDARGATFQTKAQLGFAVGFTNDVCGIVGPDLARDGVTSTSTFSNPAMVLYNQYNSPSGQPNTESGSGFGQKAMSCRTDAFGGSDIPYDNATLALLDGAPGSIKINGLTNNCSNQVNAGGGNAGGGFGPDYAPSYAPNGGTYPNAADVAGQMLSFPVAGASEAVFANLNGVCTTPPTTLTLTGSQISLLFGGEITNWNDSRLVGAGTGLGTSSCTGPVTRVVRLDKSGTTQIFKNYLKNVDGSRTGAGCSTGTTWTSLALDANNVTWPSSGTCSTLQRGDINGNPGVLHEVFGSASVTAISGAIGYADVADFKGYTPVPSTLRVSLANVRNATDTSFQPSTSGNVSNCSFSTMSTPSGTGGPVGQNFDPNNPTATTNDTWSLDNPGTIRADVTQKGAKYPICGVTFAMVYPLQTTPNAVSQLNADQRRTVYSYFTYILSSTGQSVLGGTGNGRFYSPLATSVVDQLRTAFQSAY